MTLACAAMPAGMPRTGDGPPSAQPVLPALACGAYRALADHAPVGMLIVSRRRIRYANAALAALCGHSVAELCAGMDPATLTASPDAAQQDARALPTLRCPDGRPGTHDMTCRRKDGSLFPARISVLRTEFEGQPAELVTVQDLSEAARAMHMAQQRSQLLAQTEELALSGACEYDVASGMVQQSAGMFRLFGEAADDQAVSGEWLMSRLPPAEAGFVRAILVGVRPGMSCEFEHRILRSDGALRTVLHRSMAEADAQGRCVRIISILQDITAQRAAEQQRDRLAQTDSITGLQNRNSLLDHLEACLSLARRTERPQALLMVQVQHFNLIGDSLGMSGCDQLLLAAGNRMAALMAPTDTLAHLGSGLYALLPSRREGSDETLAVQLAESVVAGFAAAFDIGDTEIAATCGVGVALFPRDGERAEQLLHQAQAAVQRTRELGDSQICVYAPDAHAEAARRLGLQAGLRRALDRGEFSLHYQPQLDLKRGCIVGVEALLRWTDAGGRAISPAEFIPLAEESGLILPIGEWVLRTACAQNVAWQREGLPPLRMAVNLSMCQLQQPDIVQRVQAALCETGLAPRHLGVEITENVLMEESQHVAGVLQTLRAMGIEISLDDFGTGYSNLSYLSRLPIDVVKVDRSFVHDVAAPAHDVSMTRAVITMAHSMHMKVLAEGVETEGQVALLMAHHCDQMQGYYFSRPVPAAEVARLLRAGHRLPERLSCGSRTLLLVDDDPVLLEALCALLGHEGYRLLRASSGAEALQRLSECHVDVIVSDQRMPGMTGVELLGRARDLYPDTVRMVLSGDTDLASVTDAVNRGAVYKYLAKPPNGTTLRALIADAFRTKERADDTRRSDDALAGLNQQLRADNARLRQQLADCARERAARDTLRAP